EPPNAADDIYGLGALAYELLSGHPPYYPNFDLKRAQTQPVPELAPTRQIPPELGNIVMRMLAKSADERPSSMQQVMDELDTTLNATLCFAPEGADTTAPDDDDSAPVPSQPAAGKPSGLRETAGPRDTSALKAAISPALGDAQRAAAPASQPSAAAAAPGEDAKASPSVGRQL